MLKFFLGGILNTIFTYLTFLVFIQKLDYLYAYSITFFLGIFLSFFINSFYVFKVIFKWSKFIQYPLIYFLQYSVGLILLYYFVDNLHVNSRLAVLLNILILTPISFVATKFFLK